MHKVIGNTEIRIEPRYRTTPDQCTNPHDGEHGYHLELLTKPDGTVEGAKIQAPAPGTATAGSSILLRPHGLRKIKPK